MSCAVDPGALPESGRLRSLAILVVSDCNLSCRYCPRNRASKRRLAWADCRAAVDWALAASGPELELVFTGGEPLLAWPLLRRAVGHVESANERQRKLSLVLQTNGTLLGRSQLAFFAEHGFEIRVSFDGVPAAQRARGRGAWERVHAALTLASSRDEWRRHLAVSMTVTPDNARFLATSVELILAMRIPRIYLSPCLTAGERRFAEWRPLLDAQFRRLHASSLAHWLRFGEVPVQAFRWSGAPSLRPTRAETPCAACSGASAALDATGELYRCALFAASAAGDSPAWQAMARRMRLAPPGRGRDGTAPAKAGDLAVGDPERRWSAHGPCAECGVLNDCRVCPFASILVGRGRGHRLRAPDFLCAFNLAAQEWKRRFPPLADRPPDAATPALIPRQMSAWREAVRALREGEDAARWRTSRRAHESPR